MISWFERLGRRLVSADTGHDFVDSCCHRIGGVLRAGPPPAPGSAGERPAADS